MDSTDCASNGMGGIVLIGLHGWKSRIIRGRECWQVLPLTDRVTDLPPRRFWVQAPNKIHEGGGDPVFVSGL